MASLETKPASSLTAGKFERTGSLIVISLLSLFLEMMLIRWIGTEVRIFAYLQNMVLVVCLLGLGMGFFTCDRPFGLRQILLPLLLLLLLLAIPGTRQRMELITDRLSVLSDLVIWEQAARTNAVEAVQSVGEGLLLTFVLMTLLWLIFVPQGQLLGRLINEHPNPIWAYSLNVGASLLGIWLFVLLSALQQPPLVWFALAGFMLLLLIRRTGRVWLELCLITSIVGGAWLLGSASGLLETHWSPYQKLALAKTNPANGGMTGVGTYLIRVNNTGYQAMIDLGGEHTQSDPGHGATEMAGLSQYDIPFLLHSHPRNALIVGAGAGNDAAGALRHGAERITAVEIDPAIVSLGVRFHPEHPYDSPRVNVVIDDARSFFATSTERYDVISFGLLDSHTTTTMTNARLDHYVYTRESLEQARSLLKDGGLIVLSFEAQKPFIADRMARVLREVFGAEPICFRIPFSSLGWGGVMFVAGDLQGARARIHANPRLETLINKWQRENPVPLSYTTAIATDDWPYLYLANQQVPVLYYLLGGMLGLVFFIGYRILGAPRVLSNWGRSHWHFFFLGAAFLLLEVQNVSKAAVVLGNTWLVNAVIVSGVLVMVLWANALAAHFPQLPLRLVYVGVWGTCLFLYWLDLASFAFLPFTIKAILVGGLTTLPMLGSGIIFIRSFASAPQKEIALGANMIGALVGGLLQSVTFVIGIKALLLIVAALYALAFLTRPPTKKQSRGPGMAVEAIVGERLLTRETCPGIR